MEMDSTIMLISMFSLQPVGVATSHSHSRILRAPRLLILMSVITQLREFFDEF
jgi:hypothetical protein